jgi:hypothetical protein
MVQKTTVWWIPISLEMYIRRFCQSRNTGGLEGYHVLRESRGRLVPRSRGSGDQIMVGINLEKSVARYSILGTEGWDIKTTKFFAGIECHLLTMRNNPLQYISIGQVLHIEYTLITFYASVKLRSEPTMTASISPIPRSILRYDCGILNAIHQVECILKWNPPLWHYRSLQWDVPSYE